MISDTQMQILTTAAQHEARLAKAPPGLPAGARNTVFRSMLKNGLLAEVAVPQEHVGLGWRQDAQRQSGWLAYCLTQKCSRRD